MYKGTGASPGVAIGKALVIEHSELSIEKKYIDNIEEEIQKLENAVKISKEEYKGVLNYLKMIKEQVEIPAEIEE